MARKSSGVGLGMAAFRFVPPLCIELLIFCKVIDFMKLRIVLDPRDIRQNMQHEFCLISLSLSLSLSLSPSLSLSLSLYQPIISFDDKVLGLKTFNHIHNIICFAAPARLTVMALVHLPYGYEIWAGMQSSLCIS